MVCMLRASAGESFILIQQFKFFFSFSKKKEKEKLQLICLFIAAMVVRK